MCSLSGLTPASFPGYQSDSWGKSKDNPVGNMLALIGEEMDYTPKKLKEVASLYQQDKKEYR